jgi:hypothetical protein
VVEYIVNTLGASNDPVTPGTTRGGADLCPGVTGRVPGPTYRDVNEQAEALRAIRSTWDGATRDGGPACGFDVAAAAYTAMQAAWFDELGVCIAIHEAADGQ